jgi:hypothetical protein
VRDLVRRFGVSGIVSWASSLAISVGAAVAIAVRTGVGGLITNVFTQIKTGAPAVPRLDSVGCSPHRGLRSRATPIAAIALV